MCTLINVRIFKFEISFKKVQVIVVKKNKD